MVLKEIPSVFVEREQMEKVIENFLINALEAIDKNGSVQVETEYRDANVMFSVSDNGQGMSREFVENSLFRPFPASLNLNSFRINDSMSMKYFSLCQ